MFVRFVMVIQVRWVYSNVGRMVFRVVNSSIWRKNCGKGDGRSFRRRRSSVLTKIFGLRLEVPRNLQRWNELRCMDRRLIWRDFSALVSFDENCGYHPGNLNSNLNMSSWGFRWRIHRHRRRSSASSIWRNFLFALLGLPPKLCLPARGLELEFELVLLRASIDTDLFWVLIWRIFFSFDLTGLQRRRRWDVKDFSGFVVQSPPRHRPLVGHDGDLT